MANVLSPNIRQWIWDDLLKVPQGFFSGQGEHPLRFGFWWRGPMIGSPGAWQNWLLGLLAIALIALFFGWERTASNTARQLRLAVAAGVAVIVPLLLPAGLGLQWWTILIALIAITVVGIIYFIRSAAVVTALARLVSPLLGAWGANLVRALGTFVVTRREAFLMGLGRLSAFGLLLMVINGVWAWNLTLGITALLLIIDVYHRDGRSRTARIILGTLRAALVAVVIFLLNRPYFQHVTTEVKPSVVAILIDVTESMSIRDVTSNNRTSGDRLGAAVQLFKDNDLALIKNLAKTHTLYFYKFDKNATEIGNLAGPDELAGAAFGSTADLGKALDALEAKSTSTQVIQSVLEAINKRKNDRLAGIVVVTDARDTPTSAAPDVKSALAAFPVKIYPIAIGSDKNPKNIVMQSADVSDSAFKDDIVTVKAKVRAVGYEPNHPVTVRLINDDTKKALIGPDGRDVTKDITLPDSNPVLVELPFKPEKIGLLKLSVEAVRQDGELYVDDNSVAKEIAILGKKIRVLYVDGYPRWEFRYIKNMMLRDKTVNISCLLISADPSFVQEHTDIKKRLKDAEDKRKTTTGIQEKRELDDEIAELKHEKEDCKFFPYTEFPKTLDQLLESDVVLFGDVDPRQFTGAQIDMLGEFVSKKGGGFAMIAGPTWSPTHYRNTAIEYLLPVTIDKSEAGWPTKALTQGFRPILTKHGYASTIFRFYPDPAYNEQYIAGKLQEHTNWPVIFWYCGGIVAKPTSTVLAEHPTDIGPDGKSAPLLVIGRFGAGRTLFSAYDESWRWRYYDGESVFDTYWTEQLRYLSRGRKRGQNKLTFGPEQKVYRLGDEVRVNLQVLDADELAKLHDDVQIEVIDGKTKRLLRTEKMLSTKEQPDKFTVSFTADLQGNFIIRPTNPHLATLARRADKETEMEVSTPNLEYDKPAVDRGALKDLAKTGGQAMHVYASADDENTVKAWVNKNNGGQALTLEEARNKLPSLIKSSQEIRKLGGGPNDPMYMFSDMPLTLAVLVLLLTLEWVVRKVCGMV